MHRRVFFGLLASLFAVLVSVSPALATGPGMVADINTGTRTDDVSVSRIVDLGERMLIDVDEGNHGSEVWVSDGTTPGTDVLLDIQPGTTDSLVNGFGLLNGVAYFSSYDGNYGSELWRSDGTVAGTYMVKDICPGDCDGSPMYFTFMDGRIYFSAADKLHGIQLWATDGTEAGTVCLSGVVNGAAGLVPGNLTVMTLTPDHHKLFFYGSDATHGQELWAYDPLIGTGTDWGAPFKDICAGSCSSSPSNLAAVGTSLYFAATNGSDGKELWTTGEGAWSAHQIEDIDPGSASSNPRDFVGINIGGTVYTFFSADDGSHGRELWRTWGSAFAEMVKDQVTGSSGSDPSYLVNYEGVLVYSALGLFTGRELYRSDGTDAGTTQVANINTVPAPLIGTYGSDPMGFANCKGVLYFSATDGDVVGKHGREIWRTDGTQAGTYMVSDVNPGTGDSTPVSFASGTAGTYFAADNGSGQALFVTDGTDAGTRRVRYFRYFQTDGLYLSSVSMYGPDGTGFVLGDKLIFTANDGTNGMELWRTDGTAAGTAMVKNIRAGSDPSHPAGYVMLNGILYFRATDGDHGYEFWRTDGSEPGTSMATNLYTGSGTGVGANGVVYNGAIYFNGAIASDNYELWRFDGTSANLAAEIRPGASGSGVSDMVVYKGYLYFSAHDGGAAGDQVWRSDGTQPGTAPVTSIGGGTVNADVSQLTVCGDLLFFTADDGTHGTELWVYDGSSAHMVKDVYLGASESRPLQLAALNGVLYFAAHEPEHGYELWRSDGSEAGTYLVKDIRPGILSSDPAHTEVINGYLYFAAGDGVNGYQAWRSDGSEAGTRLLWRWNESGNSNPWGFTLFNNEIYVAADDGWHGVEMWAMPPSAVFIPLARAK
jgi:trimeric autotransporter adhesin